MIFTQTYHQVLHSNIKWRIVNEIEQRLQTRVCCRNRCNYLSTITVPLHRHLPFERSLSIRVPNLLVLRRKAMKLSTVIIQPSSAHHLQI